MRRPATLILIVLVLVTVSAMAQEKGGCVPATLSCFLGPRIGLEYNEGKPVKASEWLRLVGIGVLINDYEAFQKNGCMGCLLENFLGPRVGRQYDYRNIRIVEWITLVASPIPQVIMAFEAFQGKTMTKIEQQENLRK